MCIYMCLHPCVCVNTSVRIHRCMSIYTYVHVNMCVCVCMYGCEAVHMRVNMCTRANMYSPKSRIMSASVCVSSSNHKRSRISKDTHIHIISRVRICANPSMRICANLSTPYEVTHLNTPNYTKNNRNPYRG